jgi:hypothetical protein
MSPAQPLAWVIEKFWASTSGLKAPEGAACADPAPAVTAVLAMAANAANHRA